MIRYVLISIILCFHFTLFSQDVTISGIAMGAENENIRIIKYKDQISYLEETIGEAVIDSIGRFSMSFQLNETSYTKINLGFHNTGFYIEPDGIYEIFIQADPEGSFFRLNPTYDSPYLNFEIINSDDNELNSMISKLNIIFEDFIINNFDAIYRQRQKDKIDTLKHIISTVFTEGSNKYFNNYVQYKIASIEQLARLKNRSSIEKLYFENKNILYENIEYMDFFNQFFSKYFTATFKKFDRDELIKIINGGEAYLKLMGSFADEKAFSEKIFSELVILKSLKDMYYLPGFSRKEIISQFEFISEKGISDKNRQIAIDLIFVLTQFNTGTPAPFFALKDRNEKINSLEDFKGKYVYLNFWASDCIPCLVEMDSLYNLKNKYENEIEFVSIGVDDEKEKLFDRADELNYNWTILDYAHDKSLLDKYKVKAYPFYVLIDKEGNILKYPANSPSENAEKLFRELVGK